MDDFEEEVIEQGNGKNPLVKVGGIVVAVAIVAALLVAGTLYFLDKGDSSEAQAGAKEDVDISLPISNKIEESDTLYFAFEDNFTVPLNNSGIETSRQRYLQISLAVAAKDSSAISTVQEHLPKIISEVEQALREQDFSTLQTNEGKLQLQLTLAELIDGLVMGESKGSHIDRVLITDFVMQ